MSYIENYATYILHIVILEDKLSNNYFCILYTSDALK